MLAGTVADMTDPQTSLRMLLPGWFYPVFLLLVMAGAMTNNVLTAYSTGLALQAVGIGWRRPVAVVFDSVIAVGITSYALFLGVSPAGAAAIIAGTTVALLCVSTSIYIGPVAGALDGADLSALAGPGLAALIYASLARCQRPAPGTPEPASTLLAAGGQ